jgi:hypothetical protein
MVLPKIALFLALVVASTSLSASAAPVPKGVSPRSTFWCQPYTQSLDNKRVDSGYLAPNMDPQMSGLWDSSQNPSYKLYWRKPGKVLTLSIDKNAPRQANVISVQTDLDQKNYALNRGDSCVTPALNVDRVQVVSFSSLSHY